MSSILILSFSILLPWSKINSWKEWCAPVCVCVCVCVCTVSNITNHGVQHHKFVTPCCHGNTCRESPPLTKCFVLYYTKTTLPCMYISAYCFKNFPKSPIMGINASLWILYYCVRDQGNSQCQEKNKQQENLGFLIDG